MYMTQAEGRKKHLSQLFQPHDPCLNYVFLFTSGYSQNQVVLNL